MADRELRRMHRAELIEIIYALKQREDQLTKENAALTAQLQDRQIRLSEAGSIAQAALELNRLFEAAQAAADDYLLSVKASHPDTDPAADPAAQARAEAQQILAQARAEAETIKAHARQEYGAMSALALQKHTQTEADCKTMVERAEQEVRQRLQALDSPDTQPLEEVHKDEKP